MASKKWSDDQRTEALRLYKECGPAEASRRTGIPAKTITSWAERSGMQSDAPANIARAVEVARLTREQRKERLAHDLLSDAERLRAQLWNPAKVHHWGSTSTREGNVVTTYTEFMEHEIPEPTFGDKRALMAAFAAAVDKFQLLTGGATSRNENRLRPEEMEKVLSEFIPDDAARRRLALKVLDGGSPAVGGVEGSQEATSG